MATNERTEIKEWFFDFLDGHERRNPSSAWKDLGPEYRRELLKKFLEQKISREEAEAASSKVCEENVHPNAHLSRLLAIVRLNRAAGLSVSREAAARESKRCPQCGGEGKTVAWVVPGFSFYDPDSGACFQGDRKYPGSALAQSDFDVGPRTFTCWCPAFCALSVWDRSHLPFEISARIVDLSSQNPNGFSLRSHSIFLACDDDAPAWDVDKYRSVRNFRSNSRLVKAL